MSRLFISSPNVHDTFVFPEIRPLSPLVHSPTLTQYDHWGRRVDELRTSEGWRKLEEFAIQEGFVADAYERKHGHLSRVHAFAKVMVMTGDCHVVSAISFAHCLTSY